MANQSTLRPELSSLLQQYLKLLRIAPKYSRVLIAAVFCTVLGAFYDKRRRAQKSADERQGQTLVRRNSAVKLTDGACSSRQLVGCLDGNRLLQELE